MDCRPRFVLVAASPLVRACTPLTKSGRSLPVQLPNLIPCNAKSSILPHLTQPSPQGFSLKIWVFKGKPLGTRLHLPHCHLAWHFCNASDRRKLERIQEQGLRAVYKTRSVSYQDLLDGAKLPMLYNTRGVRQDIATLMFKVI